MKVKVKVNINDLCKVILTKKGAEVLNKSKEGCCNVQKYEANDEYLDFLSSIMFIFGKHKYCDDLMFKNDIEII